MVAVKQFSLTFSPAQLESLPGHAEDTGKNDVGTLGGDGGG